jgi:hypothetical protein
MDVPWGRTNFTRLVHTFGSDRCLSSFASVMRVFCLLCSGMGPDAWIGGGRHGRRPPFVFI